MNSSFLYWWPVWSHLKQGYTPISRGKHLFVYATSILTPTIPDLPFFHLKYYLVYSEECKMIKPKLTCWDAQMLLIESASASLVIEYL